MASGKLIFLRPASGSGRLVLGDSHAASAIPDAEVSIDAGFAGEGAASLHLAVGIHASVDAGFAGEGCAQVQLHWDANVSRVTRSELCSAWQQAQPVAAGLGAAWQAAQPLRSGVNARWQPAQQQRGGVVAGWQATLPLRAGALSRWQEAAPLRASIDPRWQEAQRLRAAVATGWQTADRLRGAIVTHWQEMLQLRAAVRGHWQDGAPVRAPLASRWGAGRAVYLHLRPRWQEAMRPPSGVSVLPPPDRKPPCYDPDKLGRLVFTDPASGSGRLVFVCQHGGPPLPPAGIVVLPRRSYIVINSIEIRRADSPSSDPLPSESFQMSLSRQSWTWTFSASFHASARDAVAPGPGGQPVELDVRINGQPFRLQAERFGRSRRFPEHLLTVSGRGRAALLDAPHAPVQTFGHALDRTAQQLMSDVLTANGVGFGWSVDWQLTDWLVPAGVWMHQGTWSSALADIAASVGGYLQPHDTDAVLRVLPSWPKPWWEWGTLAANIELPAGIAEVDDTEIIDLPGYNRIFVSGEAQGILADLTRAGTAGDVLKPMAVHPLITDIGAARQRAIAELSESGRMLTHKMTLPVLPETGVIKPGTVLRYVDDASTPRLGLVRSTSVAHQFPVLTQSLEVQSHE